MRKMIISLFVAFVAFATTFAQTESEHLTFKGVPIDGTLDEYVAKMKQAGFTYLTEQDGIAVLEGDFAGYKGCTVSVSTLKATNVVNTIGVMFTNHDDWASLEKDYNNLKTMLTEKYGAPSECVEKFQGFSAPESNSQKMICLRLNNCTWNTVFSTSKGRIELSITGADFSYYVMLRYFDKINTDTVRAKAIDDL